MEATGNYWISLYSYHIDLGVIVYVTNPNQLDTFRKMYIRQTKNDSKDSFITAQIMRFGKFYPMSLADNDVIALPQLS
jgi:transposase